MKKWIRFGISGILFGGIIGTITSCNEKSIVNTTDIAMKEELMATAPSKQLSKEFKDYWYSGNAEITSYKLEQARYGEIREGHSVLIYVTETFAADKQVKANQNNPSNIPVLKLNNVKKYLTGIYPYSIMTSSYYPVQDNNHALKITFNAQEWCGQVYTQLNNREKFEINSFSYFENEADKYMEMTKNVLENELWNKIRINPSGLPIGKVKIIPSFEYIRMSHKELKEYDAIISLSENSNLKTYKIFYPKLERTLEINFSPTFPYTIESWTDTFKSGFGDNAKTMTSKASKMKTLKSPYWKQSGNNSLYLRDSLGL